MFTSTHFSDQKLTIWKWDSFTSKNKIPRSFFQFFATICFIGFGLIFGNSGNAQVFSPAQCNNIQCTSNDVRIINAYLTGPGGKAINCDEAKPFLNAQLHLVVFTNTQRVGVSISGNLIADDKSYPIGQCFSGVTLNAGANNDLTYELTDQLENATCETNFALSKQFISWGTGNKDFCSSNNPQCPATPAKCRYVEAPIPVDVKLAVDFTWIAGDCLKNQNGLAVDFTSSVDIENIDPSSIKYEWDFDEDATTVESIVANPKFTFPSAGMYAVTLKVSGVSIVDGASMTKSTTKHVTVESCCNLLAPTLMVEPFCKSDNKTVADLPQNVSDGNGGTYTYHWYTGADPSTSFELDPTMVLKDGDIYYVSISQGTCESPRTSVTITVNNAPNAGTDGNLKICAGSTVTESQLFAVIGTHDAGGNWSPAFAGAGTYTYTVTATAPCTDATATVTVTEQTAPNAGSNGTLTVCAGTTPTEAQLFARLGGTPDANGTWTSNGNVYTYTVSATAPCTDATATVTVSTDPAPTATVSIDGNQTCNGGIAQFKLKGEVTNASTFTWSNNGGDGTFSPASGSLTPIYTPGANDRKNGVTITLTANPTSESACKTPVTSTGVTLATTPCGPYYTYTQGYYSSTGTSCTPVGGAKGAVALIQYALNNTDGDLTNNAGKLYLGKAGASFTVTYADAANLVKIMPGGGTAAKLSKDYTLIDPKTTYPPLKNGKINNVLLSQTITLGLNINIQGDGLGSFILKTGYLTTQKGDGSTCPITKVVPCSKDKSSISSLQLATSTSLKNWIATGNKTVNDLFKLASDALGGTMPVGYSMSLTDISNAVDVINRSFDQGRFALGYYTSAQSCPPLTSTTKSQVLVDVVGEAPTTLSVAAYPNPYSSNVRFTVANPKAGQGSLEVYNLLGQKVKTVYQGYIPAGSQSYNLSLSPIQRTNLIYRLSVGDKQVTGKLMAAKE